MPGDMTPELLAELQKRFQRSVERDPELRRLTRRAAEGKAELAEVHDYAQRLGELLSDSLLRVLTADRLPDGELFRSVAEGAIIPMLKQNYRLTNDMAKAVQRYLDEAAGISLNPVDGEYPEDRVRGIAEKAAGEETLDGAKKWLGEPVVNCTESFFDGFVKANAEFRADAGLSPKIVRTMAGSCCDWCAGLAGTYDYEQVRRGSDVFRRHRFCRCTVTFINGGKRQNVWTKKTWEEPSQVLERRKTVGLEQGRGIDVTPEYFGTATPGKGQVVREPGYREDLHQDEIRMAQWIHDTFGGDIILLNETPGKGQRADYLWNGKLWDLKTTSTEKAANSAVRSGLHQIAENPGGIILNYENNTTNLSILNEIIENRMKWYEKSKADIIIVFKGKVLEILRFEK